MICAQRFILVSKKTKEMSESFIRCCGRVGINSVFALAVALWLIGLTSTAQATGKDELYRFDIQTEEIGTALNKFAVQSDSEILFSSDIVKDKQTRGLDGEYTSEEALDKLLEGTGLKAEETKEKVYLIHEASAAGVLGLAAGGQVATGEGDKQSNSEKSGEDSKKWMEEVTVTAGKRSENIQDVSMSISALTNEEIERKGLVSMQDYLSTIPGVNQIDAGPSNNQIIIRGMSTYFEEQPATTAYFGEIPLTSIVFSHSTDIKLVDIERIEVLRGPQGTLYGAGSMGGTIRHIPVAPSPNQFEAEVDIGYSNFAHSSEDSNKIVGVINVPMIQDQLALRVAAYRYDNGGYVDLISDAAIEAKAIAYGASVAIEEDVNDSTYTGGRASLLWQPADSISVTLMQISQKLETDARPDVLLPLEGYKATSLDTGKEYMTDDVDITSLVVEYNLDWATFHSSTGWLGGDRIETLAHSRILNSPVRQYLEFNKETFVQEFRLTSQLSGPLQFIGGLYYEEFETFVYGMSKWEGDLALMPPSYGPDPVHYVSRTFNDIKQKALFGELDYQISSQWKLSLGGRWFDFERGFTRNYVYKTSPAVALDLMTDEQDFTSKVAINYAPNDNILIYAQVAEGYRLGKGQPLAPDASVCDVDGDGYLDFTNAPLDPGALASDTTDNVELGGKFTLLDQRLTVNSAFYHITWDDIPIKVKSTSLACGASVQINAGRAQSQGIELESSYYLTENLQLILAASYMETELLTDNVVTGSKKGDRLPLSPRVNGNISIQYDFNLQGLGSFVRVDYGYVGGYLNEVAATTPMSGDYGKLNIRLGTTFNQLNIELYGNNLTNEDNATAYLYAGRGYRIPPRTIGLDVGYKF